MTRPKESKRVILALFSVLFLGVADNQILSPILPEIRKGTQRCQNFGASNRRR